MINDNLAFSLEKYTGTKSRYTCPYCDGKKCFTRYADQDGNYLGDHVGKCDRLVNCAAHYTPKQFFADNGLEQQYVRVERPAYSNVAPSYISPSVFRKTLTGYERNIFVQFLISHFGWAAASKLVAMYKLGTTKDGRVIYWQIDNEGYVHSGKIMAYKGDGHRDKGSHPQWVHSVLRLPNFTLNQCLFGLHLINESTSTIGILESEKSAIIASHFMPETTWLSCGGLQNITARKLAPLIGRKVVLYPDAGCYDLWDSKAKAIKGDISVSNWLENNSTKTEKEAGIDLADILLNAAV